MRFAIKTRPEHTSWNELRDVWVAADDIELFESAWNWDHFYPLTGDTVGGPNFEGWTMLAALASVTRRIRLGCQVSGMPYRHPAVLANMAATIDVISQGRLEVGLGAGWHQRECDAYGIELPPLRERFDRFDEGVQVIIGLLSRESTDFEGKHFRLTDARCEPKPVQRPHPPIVIGGRGPNRTLRSVARWAQQWNCLVSGPADWLPLKEMLLVRCDELGRDPADIVCSVNVIIDPDAGIGPAVEKVAALREAGVDMVVLNLPHRAKPAVLEPLAEALAPLA
ncbi:TIGR03560 family F420-dependent LLM class oxidoreductase [Amycolatopsis acidicola]|uniref:TIGR03560 family F420-dependent LLM class oxidoreductase n=1 Tax=Amycolatopsis acidicola TaxID=2596893 RepID=A0A5N0UWY6_9PSEU|nr:TIGR03560 family F420-dependent LLM class oxidoreductase [Amycolatopsis acidicola]KAA9153695.1 TIGR03560 family F420-dependent LLM class oxidoreductase [Amycolatopsis acidicola]